MKIDIDKCNKALKELSNYTSCSINPLIIDSDIKTLQELIDKEAPKKIEKDLEGYDAMPTSTTQCPNCKEMIWKCKDDERFKYCYCCGQALDWGNNE